MSSIFRLEEIRSYDSEEHWYRDASIGIVGHYSSLEKVMKAMRTNNQETWDAEEIVHHLRNRGAQISLQLCLDALKMYMWLLSPEVEGRL